MDLLAPFAYSLFTGLFSIFIAYRMQKKGLMAGGQWLQVCLVHAKMRVRISASFLALSASSLLALFFRLEGAAGLAEDSGISFLSATIFYWVCWLTCVECFMYLALPKISLHCATWGLKNRLFLQFSWLSLVVMGIFLLYLSCCMSISLWTSSPS